MTRFVPLCTVGHSRKGLRSQVNSMSLDGLGTVMLYECPTCGRDVSSSSQTCPGCGEPNVGEKAKDYHWAVTVPARERLRQEEETKQKQWEENFQRKSKKHKRACANGGWIGPLVGGIALGGPAGCAGLSAAFAGHRGLAEGIADIACAAVIACGALMIGAAVGGFLGYFIAAFVSSQQS